MTTKYKRGSAWKRTKWDKWSVYRKGAHIIAVLLSLICVSIMFFGTIYIILIWFGIVGFVEHIRDTILLEFMHWLFE